MGLWKETEFQNGQATVVGTVQMGSSLQSYHVFHEVYLATMQKRAHILQEKLLVTSPADHIFPPRPAELQITIELERKYGNRGATMAPLSMPELLEALNDRPSPMPEEQAAQYLGPTEAYIQALANQVKY